MASERRQRLKFGPDRPDAPPLVKRLRIWTMLAIWMFVLVFFVMPVGFGSVLFLFPAIVFIVLLILSMRQSRRPDGPDAETLHRGELAEATPSEPVSVHGVWSPGAKVRGEPAKHGFLVCDGKNLRFETNDDAILFDAPIERVGLLTTPSFMRPQLDLTIDDRTHSVRFFAMYDLGASFVGPTVAGEWYAQLRELGAS